MITKTTNTPYIFHKLREQKSHEKSLRSFKKSDSVSFSGEIDYEKYINEHSVGTTTIKDKVTKEPIEVVVTKEDRGSRSDFMLFKDSEKLGYLRVDRLSTSNIPWLSKYEKTTHPEVLEINILTSYKGNQYSGIGTELLRTAVQESKNRGFKGHLALQADNRLSKEYVGYRKTDSPVPFYYNFGFTSSPYYNFVMKTYSKLTGKYDLYPHMQMYLTKEAREKWLNSLEKSQIFKETN